MKNLLLAGLLLTVPFAPLTLRAGNIVFPADANKSYSSPVPMPQSIPSHPRLLAGAEQFDALRARVKTDPLSAALLADLHLKAEAILSKPPLTYQKVGKRLLAVSREAIKRISTLALLARITDDPRYAKRAIEELLAVTAFQDWNPSHYLDTAEMSLAVGIGYDWLYDQMTAEDRVAVGRGLLELGLKQSEAPSKNIGWITARNNWGQVCHGGMVAGAIALADEQPELAQRIITRAVGNLHFSAESYAPDGAYPEGPSYWSYGTTYHVILIDALEQFTGQAHGLDRFTGFIASADYMLQMTTPTGLAYSYADSSLVSGYNLTQYWFARITGRPDLLFGNDALLAANPLEKVLASQTSRFQALALLWRLNSKPAFATNQPPRSWFGRGDTPVAIHRSSWGDTRATFIGLKGGKADSSHSHMDSGSFLLEANGVRWAVDLGMQDYYPLESKGIKLWTFAQDSDRWKVFRIGPESHNILRFNGKPPLVDGKGTLTRFSASSASSVVNLDAVYANSVKSVSRGVQLLPDRSVLIQDEWIASANPVTVTWQFLTEADTIVVGTNEATLKQGKETLTLRVLEPSDAKIAVVDMSAPRADYDAPNPNLKRLTLTTHSVAGASGCFRVLAVPGSTKTSPPPATHPLAEWGDPVPSR